MGVISHGTPLSGGKAVGLKSKSELNNVTLVIRASLSHDRVAGVERSEPPEFGQLWARCARHPNLCLETKLISLQGAEGSNNPDRGIW